MPEQVEVTELVEIIEVDETHVELIEVAPSAPVTSVNGKIGAVELDASDVEADPLGSALQAYLDAQDYANTLAQGLSDAITAHATNTSSPAHRE